MRNVRSDAASAAAVGDSDAAHRSASGYPNQREHNWRAAKSFTIAAYQLDFDARAAALHQRAVVSRIERSGSIAEEFWPEH